MSSLEKNVVLFYLQLEAMWQGSAGGREKVYYCFIKSKRISGLTSLTKKLHSAYE